MVQVLVIIQKNIFKISPDIQIYAFEPHPITYKKLTMSVVSKIFTPLIWQLAVRIANYNYMIMRIKMDHLSINVQRSYRGYS